MKILIIRFSSIGDIVLTTPIVRCLKKQLPGCEIHFITKKVFQPVITHNPYIDKIHPVEEKLADVFTALRKEQFDYVIDLHKNLRSARLKRALGVKSFSFNKLNVEKWLFVNFKINLLPNVHIVNRYFETVKNLGVVNDEAGLDHFIADSDVVDIEKHFPLQPLNYHALVAGGSYYTKRVPLNKLEDICNLGDKKILVLGGKEDADTGIVLEKRFPGKVFNACGKFSINQSASLIQQADKVITSDTGLMHIAAAYKKDIFSVWGNTVPDFGMYPYQAGEGSMQLEVKGLPCRPCSKLGYSKCPKGHFKCMQEQDISVIFK